jgi:hypothetical protein
MVGCTQVDVVCVVCVCMFALFFKSAHVVLDHA